MTRLHIIASQRSSQFSALKRYLSDNRITHELAAKVQRNAQYALSEQKRNAPESSIELLHIISDPLRSELHFEVHSRVLLVHPFFKCYSEIQSIALHKICHHAISRLTFAAGDIVFTDGEHAAVPKMYIVAKGKLLYAQDNEPTIVCKNDWISEAVLWTEWCHLGSLNAGVDVQLLTLEAQKFQNVAAKFPSVQVRNYASAFVDRLCKTLLTDLTDVGNHKKPEESYALIETAFPYGGNGSSRNSYQRHSILSARPSGRNSIIGLGKRNSVTSFLPGRRSVTSQILSPSPSSTPSLAPSTASSFRASDSNSLSPNWLSKIMPWSAGQQRPD